MRLFTLTLLALIAFAANSVLNRAALADAQIGPAAFTALRLTSGAVMLGALVFLRNGAMATTGSLISAAALLVYAGFFSFAYLGLDAGLGALVLFGMVQITMFGLALRDGVRPGWRRWTGSGLGLAGLAVLLLPGASAPPWLAFGAMAVAGIAWGVYTYRGRTAGPPLEATAGNFLYTVPVIWLLWGIAPVETAPTLNGAMLAIASGAIASGLGYALWYSVLPRLETTLAAIAQLTVPLIAALGGMIWLGETPGLTFVLASALIIGGVLLALRREA